VRLPLSSLTGLVPLPIEPSTEVLGHFEIRVGTVQQHLHHIYKKRAVPSRNEAVNKYFGRMGADPSST